MIKAIIFDVDGTLSDNVDALAKGWKLFAKNLNLKPPTKKQVKDFLGIPYYEIAPQLWPQFNPYEHAEEFKRCVTSFAKDMRSIIGKKEIVLLKKRYKIGIVTSARRNNIKAYMGDLVDLFDVIVAAEDTEKHKPDPYPLLLCCKKLNVKPEDAIYVGDAIFDYLCARGAGTSFVGVLTGVGNGNYFKKLNAPYIKSVKHICSYVDDLNKR